MLSGVERLLQFQRVCLVPRANELINQSNTIILLPFYLFKRTEEKPLNDMIHMLCLDQIGGSVGRGTE